MLPTGNVENFTIPHDSSRPIWEDRPYSLVSLYEMIQFSAHTFFTIAKALGTLRASYMNRPSQEIISDSTEAIGGLENIDEQCNVVPHLRFGQV